MKNKYLIIIFIITGIGIIAGQFFFKHDQMGQDTKRNMKKEEVVEKIEKNKVNIKNYEFTPGKITVKKGTTITFENLDIAPHTVTVDDESIEGPKSKLFGKGETFQYTFDEVGSFPYHCQPHPYMKGVIEVIE